MKLPLNLPLPTISKMANSESYCRFNLLLFNDKKALRWVFGGLLAPQLKFGGYLCIKLKFTSRCQQIYFWGLRLEFDSLSKLVYFMQNASVFVYCQFSFDQNIDLMRPYYFRVHSRVETVNKWLITAYNIKCNSVNFVNLMAGWFGWLWMQRFLNECASFIKVSGVQRPVSGLSD